MMTLPPVYLWYDIIVLLLWYLSYSILSYAIWPCCSDLTRGDMMTDDGWCISIFLYDICSISWRCRDVLPLYFSPPEMPWWRVPVLFCLTTWALPGPDTTLRRALPANLFCWPVYYDIVTRWRLYSWGYSVPVQCLKCVPFCCCCGTTTTPVLQVEQRTKRYTDRRHANHDTLNWWRGDIYLFSALFWDDSYFVVCLFLGDRPDDDLPSYLFSIHGDSITVLPPTLHLLIWHCLLPTPPSRYLDASAYSDVHCYWRRRQNRLPAWLPVTTCSVGGCPFSPLR